MNIATAAAIPVKLAIVLYLIFFAFAFMMGFADTKPGSFLFKIIKALIVLWLATNVCPFFNFIYNFFMSGMNTFAVLAVYDPLNPPDPANPAESTIYGNVDKLFNMMMGCVPGALLECQAIAKLVALMVAFALTGSGIVVTGLLFAGALTVFYAFFRYLVTFGIAIIGLTFTLMFAPIFLCFLLFEETRDLFYNWLGIVISYTLQPIIIIFFLALMSKILDFSFITNQLASITFTNPDGSHRYTGVIEDYTYTVNLIFWEFPVQAYKTTKGLFEEIKIDDPSTGIDDGTSMNVFSIICLYTMIWLATAMAALRFLDVIPTLAQRLSAISQAPIVPNIGATHSGATDGGGSYKDWRSGGDGMALPGLTHGMGGRAFTGKDADGNIVDDKSWSHQIQRGLDQKLLPRGLKFGGRVLGALYRKRGVPGEPLINTPKALKDVGDALFGERNKDKEK